MNRHTQADNAGAEDWQDDVWSYDDEDGRRSVAGRPKRRLGAAIASFAVLGAVCAGGWYLSNSADNADGATTAPLILASSDPVKVVPKEKGGLKVPHRNVEVYARIETATPEKALRKATPKPESLLPPPVDLSSSKPGTAPVPEGGIAKMATGPAPVAPDGRPRAGREALSLTPKAAAPAPDAKFEPAAVPAALKPSVPENARPSIRPAVPETIAAIPLVRPEPAALKAKDKTKPRRPDGPRTTAELIGPYRIQIGAFRNPMQAHDRWSRLKRRHGDLLGDKVMVIERVNLGPRGIMYRLQAGPMQTPSEVKSLCNKLGQRRVGCILVRG